MNSKCGVLLVLLHRSGLNIVTFVNDYSKSTLVYLLKSKSDVFAAFKSFHNMILT